jgi:hypothetical protein
MNECPQEKFYLEMSEEVTLFIFRFRWLPALVGLQCQALLLVAHL